MVGLLSHVIVGCDWPLRLRLCFALSLTELSSFIIVLLLRTYSTIIDREYALMATALSTQGHLE